MTLLRIKSHRARDRAERTIGRENMRELFSFSEGHYYEVADELVTTVLAIKGTNRARPPRTKLYRTWETM